MVIIHIARVRVLQGFVLRLGAEQSEGEGKRRPLCLRLEDYLLDNKAVEQQSIRQGSLQAVL